MKVPLDFGEPRKNCLYYVLLHGGGENACAYLLTRRAFDEFIQRGFFSDGPFVEFFGDLWGEPYNYFKQAYGTLIDGTIVYCELNTQIEQKFFSSFN